jgi:NitT/TauT family transport system substrate-binding protein
VLKSYDVLGGAHTNGVLMTTRRFRDANPKTTAAVLAAVNEANAYIQANPRGAAEAYMALSGEKLGSLEEMVKMVADPDVTYTTTPVRVMDFAEFMFKVGRIKHQPKAWTDFFFPEAQRLPGS